MIWFVLTTLCLVSVTFADQNLIGSGFIEKEVFKTTLAYLIESERLDEAKKLTEKHLKDYPNDPYFHRSNGLIHYLNKNYDKAIVSFQKAASLSVGSEKASNLYLISQSLIKLNKFKEAETILLKMETIPESKDYAAQALDTLRKSNEIPEYIPPAANSLMNTSSMALNNNTGGASSKKNITFNANGVYGLDSNPVFIPDFSQEKNDAASGFYSLSSSLGLNSQLAIGKLNNTFNVGYTTYIEEIAKSFDNFRLSLITQFDAKSGFLNRYGITLLNKLDRSYQAEKNLEYYFTSDVFSLKKDFIKLNQHTLTGQLSLGFRTYANTNLVNKEDDRSGASYGARGIYKYTFQDWAFINSLGVTNQKTYGGKFDTMATDFGANIQKILIWDIEAMLGGSLTRIDYVNSEEDRVDLMSSYGIDFSRDLGLLAGASLKLSYSRTKNNSDLDPSTYTQDIYSFWINYDY